MSPLERLIHKAVRRRRLHAMLRLGGWGMTMGLAVGLVGLGLDRIFMLHIGLWVFTGLAGVGGMVGVAWALLMREDRLGVAVELDRQLRLRDRLGSAYSLRSEGFTNRGDSLAPLVMQEADDLAARVDCRSVMPIRMTGIWGMALVLSLVLAGGYGWLPQHSPARNNVITSRVESDPEVIREREEMTAVVKEVQAELATLEGEDTEDERWQEDMNALEALTEQLSGEASPDREELAARINEMADDLESEAERNLLATEKLAQRFRGMPEREIPLAAQEFEEALKRGDFGDAADLLDRMREEAAQWTEDEQVTAVERLRKLGEAVRDADSEEIDKAREELELALEDQGLEEEEIEAILEDKGGEETEKQLTEGGVNEEVAQQLAREVEKYKRDREQQEEVEREGEEVGQALEEAADSISQPSENEEVMNEPPDKESPKPPVEGEQTGADQGESGETERVVREEEGADEDAQVVEEEEVTEPSDEQKGPPAGMEMLKKLMESMDPETLRKLAESVDPEALKEMMEKMDPEMVKEMMEKVDPELIKEMAEKMEPEQLQELMDGMDPEKLQKLMDAMDPEKMKEMMEEISPQPADTQEDMESEGEGKSPSEVLRDMARRRQDSERKQNVSKELRDRARELLEGVSPEERERWAEAWDKSNKRNAKVEAEAGREEAEETGDIRTEVLDITGDTDEGEIVAKWWDEEIEPGEWENGDGRKSSSGRRLRINTARKRAERAVEEQAVPKRYHDLIKRYFGRLQETAEGAPEGKTGGKKGVN